NWEPLERDPARAKALLEGALARGSRLGIVFQEKAQASLFDIALFLAVGTDAGVALFEGEDAKDAFARVVEQAPFAALDVKHALKQLYPADSSLPALISEDALFGMDAFDLSQAAYVLDSSAENYSLERLMGKYRQASLPESKDEGTRLAIAAAATRSLVGPLSAALESDGSFEVYSKIDAPLIAVLTHIERNGAAIDVGRLEALGLESARKMDALRERIFAIAGEEFNVDSPKQLSYILFDVLGLKPTKKTQTGFSTDASVLKELATKHELPEMILSYRELAKIKSTYIDALPRMRAGDGRVHTSFNGTVTTTGRLSSSDPNLQNIPVRTDFGRQIRECFLPLVAGEKFLSADYSQIELRLLAHLSGDRGLIEAFCSGIDFHAQTAARVFDLPVEAITPELRSRAKAVNFGIVYGQQAFGLSQSLQIPFYEAKEMIDRYFMAYPGVSDYLQKTIEEAKTAGFALTMFGRKRHVPELRAKGAQFGFGERVAMNHPMQGSAADIIKLAMIEMQRRLMAGGFKAKLILQVHD
ncbi:MAG: DNA polymerase, partial [Eggerthellaceae bacterium]|nr:DNA polymerase [Eggerthellaceae bacterium]